MQTRIQADSWSGHLSGEYNDSCWGLEEDSIYLQVGDKNVGHENSFGPTFDPLSPLYLNQL